MNNFLNLITWLPLHQKHVLLVGKKLDQEIVTYLENQAASVATSLSSKNNKRKQYDLILFMGTKAAPEYASSMLLPNYFAQLANLLTPNGDLFIFIENKYGLGRFSGRARGSEPHKRFAPLEQSRTAPFDGPVAMSKPEIEAVAAQLQLVPTYYYPWPSLQKPTEIYSHDFKPGPTLPINPSSIPKPSLDKTDSVVFNELLAWNAILEDDMFEEFAPCFFVNLRRKN